MKKITTIFVQDHVCLMKYYFYYIFQAKIGTTLRPNKGMLQPVHSIRRLCLGLGKRETWHSYFATFTASHCEATLRHENIAIEILFILFIVKFNLFSNFRSIMNEEMDLFIRILSNM